MCTTTKDSGIYKSNISRNRVSVYNIEFYLLYRITSHNERITKVFHFFIRGMSYFVSMTQCVPVFFIEHQGEVGPGSVPN